MTSTMNRRTFLQVAGTGMAAAIAGCASKEGMASAPTDVARRPNILFCISDDQSFAHTGAMGDTVVKTPVFDRVAREGVLFTNAFTVSPSCSPSRACILTGQHIWRLKEAGNLWSTVPAEFDVYTDMLAAAGYHVGCQGKGWGPGNVQAGGRTVNAAGKGYKSFDQFLAERKEGQPFCFWFGSQDPHRPYEAGSGIKSGKRTQDVKVPPFLADSEEVRSDILDYYFEIERYDQQVGQLIQILEDRGELDNTIVIITSDNGMPFPRAKTNLYDYGAHLPLAIRYPKTIKGGRKIDDFVSFTDYAPTLLEACGLRPAKKMSGKSFWGVLTSGKSGRVDRSRDHVLLGRERHANARPDNVGYPCRAIRTDEFLYVRNIDPQRWPAGDPSGPYAYGGYGDIDAGPTKKFMQDHADDPKVKPLFDRAFGMRPAEELYDLENDPGQLNNVANAPAYAAKKRQMASLLERRLKDTGDPRFTGGEALWDNYLYYGGGSTPKPQTRPARARGR